MMGRVALRRMDEASLEGLLAVAVDDAAPEEVMPPWPGHRDGRLNGRRPSGLGIALGAPGSPPAPGVHLRDHSRRGDRGRGPPGRPRSGEALETGMWLARSQRGRGIGTAVLRALLDEAARAGARVVVADTTAQNAAALAALRRNGATLTSSEDTADVHAELTPRAMPSTPPPTASR